MQRATNSVSCSSEEVEEEAEEICMQERFPVIADLPDEGDRTMP